MDVGYLVCITYKLHLFHFYVNLPIFMFVSFNFMLFCWEITELNYTSTAQTKDNFIEIIYLIFSRHTTKFHSKLKRRGGNFTETRNHVLLHLVQLCFSIHRSRIWKIFGPTNAYFDRCNLKLLETQRSFGINF